MVGAFLCRCRVRDQRYAARFILVSCTSRRSVPGIRDSGSGACIAHPLEAPLRPLLLHAGKRSYHAWFLQEPARYAEGSLGVDAEMMFIGLAPEKKDMLGKPRLN